MEKRRPGGPEYVMFHNPQHSSMNVKYLWQRMRPNRIWSSLALAIPFEKLRTNTHTQTHIPYWKILGLSKNKKNIYIYDEGMGAKEEWIRQRRKMGSYHIIFLLTFRCRCYYSLTEWSSLGNFVEFFSPCCICCFVSMPEYNYGTAIFCHIRHGPVAEPIRKKMAI